MERAVCGAFDSASLGVHVLCHARPGVCPSVRFACVCSRALFPWLSGCCLLQVGLLGMCGWQWRSCTVHLQFIPKVRCTKDPRVLDGQTGAWNNSGRCRASELRVWYVGEGSETYLTLWHQLARAQPWAVGSRSPCGFNLGRGRIVQGVNLGARSRHGVSSSQGAVGSLFALGDEGVQILAELG